MRKPIVAGQFYPADKTELEKQVKENIKKHPDNKIIAGIVPHAGYIFSGKCAGKVYSLLPKADTYVILGTAHQTLGAKISVSTEDFETALGVIKNDTELAREILKQINRNEDNELHKYEHSIEVQLPFLQLTQKQFKIVPILIGEHTIESCKLLAKSIKKAADKLKRKIIVIASSDFTHSGPSYEHIIDKKIDKDAINKILKLDSKGFLDVAKKTTICGAGAICTVIESIKLQGCKKAELLDYYTSHDIMPGENWVGYAGIVFY